MNKQQSLALLTLIADLYQIINEPEKAQEIQETEVVFPHAVPKVVKES